MVEVRKVETTIGETGVGQVDRVETSYELGETIDGAWVRFASVSQAVVDAAKAATPLEPTPAPPTPTTPEPAPDPTPPSPEQPADGGGASEPAPSTETA